MEVGIFFKINERYMSYYHHHHLYKLKLSCHKTRTDTLVSD